MKKKTNKSNGIGSISEFNSSTEAINAGLFSSVKKAIGGLRFRIDALYIGTHGAEDMDVSRLTPESFNNMNEQLAEMDCILSYLEDEVWRLSKARGDN